MSYHSRLLAFTIALLLIGGVAFHTTRAEEVTEAPQLFAITPEIGERGRLVFITGTNFTDNNTVDWGFGRVHGMFSTGAPALQTIAVPLSANCPENETCDPVPTHDQGWIDIVVTNENGTSNAVQFLLAPHNSACYYVDDMNDPQVITPVACDDPQCVAGACETPEASPSPSPSPTPTPDTGTDTEEDEDEDDEDDEGGNDDDDDANSDSSGAAANTSSTPRVAGTRRRGPSAAHRAASDFIKNDQVPLIVEKWYQQVWGRSTTYCTSDYWKVRARSDKATESSLLGAMRWQKQHGRNPVFRSCLERQQQTQARAQSASGETIAPRHINRLFRLTHGGVSPTPAQNRYWLSRLADKPTVQAMMGAMQWHAQNGTGY